MKQLKNSMINNEKDINDIFEKLEKIQKNLLKNYLNPVFSKMSKTHILDTYSKLSDLGTNLYKYNMLKLNGLNMGVEGDESSEIVLKGHISNTEYIWHSEHDKKTCAKCLELDGTKYDFFEEVPKRPHPNCKCYVEEKEKEEECNCYEILEAFDNFIEQIDTLKTVVEIKISYWLEQIQYDFSIKAGELGQLILTELTQLDNWIGDLSSEFKNSRDEIFINSDKYYHTKAFCKVAQRENEYYDYLALKVGQFRELGQFIEHIVTLEQTYEEAKADKDADNQANENGIRLGKEHPNEDCGEILNKIWKKD